MPAPNIGSVAIAADVVYVISLLSNTLVQASGRSTINSATATSLNVRCNCKTTIKPYTDKMETTIEDNKPEDSGNLNQDEKKSSNPLSFFSTEWKFNVVDNPDAPQLYSRKAIYYFTVACSPFFGGVLMFNNLRKLKNSQGQLVVATYTILYCAISWTILAQFERNTILTLMVSMIGSFALYNLFWKKYIGVDIEYRPKSILTSLIIALVFFALFTLIVVANIEEFK